MLSFGGGGGCYLYLLLPLDSALHKYLDHTDFFISICHVAGTKEHVLNELLELTVTYLWWWVDEWLWGYETEEVSKGPDWEVFCKPIGMMAMSSSNDGELLRNFKVLNGLSCNPVWHFAPGHPCEKYDLRNWTEIVQFLPCIFLQDYERKWHILSLT
jgi:hypothetical protein